MLSGVLTVLLLTFSDLALSCPDDSKVNWTSLHGQEGHYRFAAVTSKSRTCSRVGNEIMARSGGNVIDAAVASLACIGVDTLQSCGIGGDSLWTYYEKKSGKTYSIIARSKAPLASNISLYVNNTGATLEGGLAISVPGDVLGLWEAHQRFGKLPWYDLFQPAIKIAQEGYPVEDFLSSAILAEAEAGILDRWPILKSLVTNPTTNTWYKTGEIMKNPLLANTLQRIAVGGAPEFYNGILAHDIVEEVQNAGGLITKEDLSQYTVDVTETIRLDLHDNLTMFSPPLPSGGPVVQYILNILNGYHMTSDDLSTNARSITTFHRIIEAFKHAYAARSQMGSPYGETAEFVEQMKQLVANITSPSQGDAIRSKIRDDTTFNYTSYNPSFVIQDDHGTSHLSIMGPNGDAVSVTSTINNYFGSKVVGSRTGIVYNNLMDDFSVPGLVNAFGVEPSPANFIKPGKRPLSSMSPSIVVNSEGMPVLVVGCSGGTRIITTVAFVTAATLWLGEGIKGAIDAPRLHHQLYPDHVLAKEAPQWLINGLTALGHTVVKESGYNSVPNGILQKCYGEVTACSQSQVTDGY